MKRKKKIDITGYLMILPAYSIYLIFVLIPLIMGLFYSFTNYNFNTMEFVGLANYKALINDKIFIKSVVNTLVYAAGTVGYNMVINLSGLQGIPDSLYEAAKVDGATGIRQFFSITLPMLRPTTFFLVVTGCINSFLVFEQVNIMTSGGPMHSTTTIVHQIYKSAFLDLRMGYGSAMAMVLLLLTIGITLMNFKYGNQGSDLDLS